MPNRATRLLSAALLALGCAGDPATLARGELLLESPDTSDGGGPLRLRLYLPEGSGAGRPFWIDDARATIDGGPLFREAGTFDAAGRATLTCRVLGACTGELDAATGCVRVVGDRATYLPQGGDIAYAVDGTIDVCPIDGEPATRAASLSPSPQVEASAPLTALTLRNAVPLDQATLESVRVTQDGADVAAHHEGDAFGGRLVLDSPVDPEGTIAIETSGVRDVLGNPVELTTTVLTTSAVLADLSLDAAPNEGAIAGYGAELATGEGALIATDRGSFPRIRPFLLVIALGDPGAATAVRIEGHQVQRYGAHVTARVARAGGAVGADAVLPFATGTLDAPIPAGTGAIWLVLHSDQDLGQPRDRFDADFVTLESLALVTP